MNETSDKVLVLADSEQADVRQLLASHGLELKIVARGQPIPGSFWGEAEAGLIRNQLYARQDTPLHSILHEACHYICMDEKRKAELNTNAGGDYDEENAVCYLQILLSDQIANFGRDRAMRDMDHWGYSFRLGSARAWFEGDAEDARQWLEERGLLPG